MVSVLTVVRFRHQRFHDFAVLPMNRRCYSPVQRCSLQRLVLLLCEFLQSPMELSLQRSLLPLRFGKVADMYFRVYSLLSEWFVMQCHL